MHLFRIALLVRLCVALGAGGASAMAELLFFACMIPVSLCSCCSFSCVLMEVRHRGKGIALILIVQLAIFLLALNALFPVSPYNVFILAVLLVNAVVSALSLVCTRRNMDRQARDVDPPQTLGNSSAQI